MFLAIINDTYSEVKEEISAQKNDFEVADYFKRGYNNMLGKVTSITNDFQIINGCWIFSKLCYPSDKRYLTLFLTIQLVLLQLVITNCTVHR